MGHGFPGEGGPPALDWLEFETQSETKQQKTNGYLSKKEEIRTKVFHQTDVMAV